MTHFQKMTIAAAAALGLTALLAAAPSFAAKGKPAPKKPKKPAGHTVLGTQQLKGGDPKLGETWTLGKTDPINIAVNKVYYSAERIAIGTSRYVPKCNEKVLVIEFMLQNPQHGERVVRFDTVHWTAVDNKDVNREAPQTLGAKDGKGGAEELNVNFKPGQRRDVFTYIVLPADATVPKLIAKASDDLVLRYDLRGKIGPLAPLYADPKDKDGATALKEVPAALNATFPIGNGDGATWDITVEKVAFVDKLPDVEVQEKHRLLVMTGKVTGQNADKTLFRFDTIHPLVRAEDGEEVVAAQELLHATADRSIEHNLEAGASGRFRMYFQVPEDFKLKTLVVRENEEARGVAVDISDVK